MKSLCHNKIFLQQLKNLKLYKMVVVSWIWKIWFLIYMFISTIIFYPFLWISIVVLKNYPLTFKIYKIWGSSICFFLGIYPVLEGIENLPKNNGYILSHFLGRKIEGEELEELEFENVHLATRSYK